jgi:hypothetical protein
MAGSRAPVEAHPFSPAIVCPVNGHTVAVREASPATGLRRSSYASFSAARSREPFWTVM